MLAPSFPVMYPYPGIIGRLRRLGFEKVVEVTAGAAVTNAMLVSAFRNDPEARYITSPCPSFVRLVRRKFPDLLDYVAMSVDSPMAATAKIVQTKFSGYRPVFVGPCIAKKMEAKEDVPHLNIIVLSYMELESLFAIFDIGEDPSDRDARFDLVESGTRTYPIDGGLTDTSGIRSILRPEEIRVVSGYKACETALTEFESDKSIRLLDVLFCDDGCIMGPGISSPLSKDERIGKVRDYAQRQTV